MESREYYQAMIAGLEDQIHRACENRAILEWNLRIARGLYAINFPPTVRTSTATSELEKGDKGICT